MGASVFTPPQPGRPKKGENARNHSAYRGKPDVRVEFPRISYVFLYFLMIPCIFLIFSYFFLGFSY